METCHWGRIWTPFPLMGKGRDRGAREPIKQSPLPLSFPVEGKDLVSAQPPVDLFHKRPPVQPSNQFSKEGASATSCSWRRSW
jgi:hypothetical protein